MASIIKNNNLGNFADLSAVWSIHPEGGREGDYLTINREEYSWDKYERDWVKVGSSSGGGGHASEGSIVEGDLSVGGNLDVGGNAHIHGDLTIDGELNVPGGERFKGQSSYKSIVFCRSESRPDAPTGGSFSNPLPDGRLWKDGVPQGNNPIWMSSRVFTSDGQPPEEDAWSVPSLMSDAENFDVEFSNAPASSVPTAPNSSNLNYLWFDPVRNPSAPWDKMNWMATRTKSLDSQGNAVWSSWTIVLIKGESGEGVQTVYKVTTGSTPSISGTAYPPEGWYKDVDSLTLNTGDVLWMSERRFESGAWSAWSSPIRISGEDGDAGKDGTDIHFIYKRMNRLPNTGGNVDSAPSDPTQEGWVESPLGVDATHRYEWMCQRIKGPNDTNWGAWNGPFVWSAWGEKGTDGDGVEYVFIRSKSIGAGPGLDATNTDSNSHTASDREYLPRATSTLIDVEDNNSVKEYTDGPTGVNPTYPYEWVAMRRQVNGVWQAFGTPALWACYSEEHTVEISDDGYWIIDGVTTDKRATGVNIKGRVDVYLDSDAESGQKSLETYPKSLTGDDELQVGDCWIVESGTDGDSNDISGHLFICVNPSGTSITTMWQDLGEFKGDPGQSQYMHLAWAERVTFNPFSVVNPTRDPAAGRNYDWMGIKVTNGENDTPGWSEYKWNYLKGKDGMDVEYVYIRTKVNTAPTITEAANQNDEHLPVVGNQSDYTSVDMIDYNTGNTFWDDPNGVEERWPYEWMSKREKTNGVWGPFLQTARLWAKWGEPGKDAVMVKTDPAVVIVDADEDGKIAAQTSYDVKCWLYKGGAAVAPIVGSCSASYNGSPLTPVSLFVDVQDPYVTYRVILPAATTLTNKDLYVELANNECSASTKVPITIVKRGQQGQSVLRSTVFRYYTPTTQNPVPAAPTGGDYLHPAGVNESEWSDGIPSTGSGPLWMSHRLFTSDGAAPQESTWSTPVMAQDIEDKVDIEYSPEPIGTAPEAPDGTNQSGSGNNQIWYDRTLDEDADWSSMNWMAIRYRESASASWSDWVISQIRGEKGDDGAGQAYVETDVDQIVIDCGPDGKPKANDIITKSITAKLKWGTEDCNLVTTGTPKCSITEDTAGSISVNYPISSGSNKKSAVIGYTIGSQGIAGTPPTFPVLSSGLITILLVGTDSNSVQHIATKTIPVIANVQGATGNVGPVLRFRGEWSSSETYTFNDTFRDCVKHNDVYYILSQRHDGTTTEPYNGSNIWTSMGGDMKFFATELLLAENAVITLLSSNTLIFTNEDGNKTAGINEDGQGSFKTYYPDSGRLRKDDNANGWTYYYDDDINNTLLWMLGPSGVIIHPNTVESWDIIRLHYFGTNVSSVPSPSSGATWDAPTNYYQYSNSAGGDYNGKVFKAHSSGQTPAQSTIADNGYYTPDAGIRNMNNGDDTPEYVFTLYKIEGGIIKERKEVSSNDV